MKWSYTIAKIGGTQVRLHTTFLFFILVVAINFYVTGGPTHAIRGTLLLLGIFFCVLLHEFGHVVAALRYGITTPSITLFPLGGLAALTRIPKKPVQELVVAIAGPTVNVIIALILILINGGLNYGKLPDLENELPILNSLIWVNLALVIFNLIPAFPMDGGRIFRALLTMVLPRPTATHLAVTIGQSIAIGGAILAIATGQLFLALIAVFIFFAGKGEEAMVDQESLLEGKTADDAGMIEFKTFNLDDRLSDVIGQILAGDQDSFPVVNDASDCIAAISLNEILATIQHVGADALVRDAVDAIPEQIKGDTPAFQALQKLIKSRQPGAAVVDEQGKLTKWLTTRQFEEFMAIQALSVHRIE